MIFAVREANGQAPYRRFARCYKTRWPGQQENSQTMLVCYPRRTLTKSSSVTLSGARVSVCIYSQRNIEMLRGVHPERSRRAQHDNEPLVRMNYCGKPFEPKLVKSENRANAQKKHRFTFLQALEIKGILEEQSGANRTEKRAKSMQWIECKGITMIFRANRSICNKTKEMQEPVRFVSGS
ncbi:MAG TPA: hypothetical protein VGY31_00500 [Terriglobia bacterium]|nr:hypothetical protein [Terriglobia bacterium]